MRDHFSGIYMRTCTYSRLRRVCAPWHGWTWTQRSASGNEMEMEVQHRMVMGSFHCQSTRSG